MGFSEKVQALFDRYRICISEYVCDSFWHTLKVGIYPIAEDGVNTMYEALTAYFNEEQLEFLMYAEERESHTYQITVKFYGDSVMFVKTLIEKIRDLKPTRLRTIQKPPIEGSFKQEDYARAVQVATNWYNEKIEDPLKEIVCHLRNHGINTECSCGHDMYIQCQYVVDGQIMEIHKLVYDYLHAHNLPINFEIHMTHKVQDGYISTSLDIEFLQNIPWRRVFPNYNVGTALRGARHREGLTQQQLAGKLGVSRTAVSLMENCKKSITEDMAKQLSRVLNIGYKVFLEK